MYHVMYCSIITTCACARGQVIGRVIVVVIAVDTKITKSGDLST